MSDLHTMEDRMNALFGEPVDLPTVDELVDSGALVDGTDLYAAGNGSDPNLQPRLLFSADAWADLAAWSEDNAAYQDVSGRIHDVVAASRFWHPLTGRCNTNMLAERTVFSLTRIPNTPRATIPRHTNATVYPFIDNGRLTLTFRLVYE